MRNKLVTRVLLIAFLSLMSGASITTSEEPNRISLAQIDGRDWLIDLEGRPFFPHGVTHVAARGRQGTYDDLGRRLKELGFNAYGYGCPPALKKDLPYLEGRNYIPISTYRGDGSFQFVDIFDPRVQQQLAEQVRQVCEQNRDKSNLIGYFWTDLAAWPLENSVGKNWVEFTRKLPEGSPGRSTYEEFLATWEGDDSKARDLEFLRLIARKYFQVMGEANRKHDPDHLIFGDRFAFNTIVSEVIEEIVPWVDAIAIQPPFQVGFPTKRLDEIHAKTGKPIILCDFAIRFQDADKPIRGWKPQATAEIAGKRYAEYVRDACDTSYIVGVFWCNPIDSTPAFNKSGIKQGLFDADGSPRPKLNQELRELNRYIEQVPPKT